MDIDDWEPHTVIAIIKAFPSTVHFKIDMLLSKDFVCLVIIAFPTTWWAASAWLRGYAYHVAVGWTVFMLAGLVVLSAAIIAVGFHAAKAAVENPARALRAD